MLIDSHCHLDFPQLAGDIDGVLDRARAAGVAQILTISTRMRQFDRIRMLAHTYPQVFCSVGTHPHNADEEQDMGVEDILAFCQEDKVIAIGEAGLDYYYDNASRAAQQQGLRIHIAAARQSGLPLVIHARDADDDMIRILEDENGRGAFPFVLHCFSSGLALAQAGIKLGGYISFSGILTFNSAQGLRDIARQLPLERLLVETDAPYLAPVPHRGKTNEPAFVSYTAGVLAGLRNLEPDALAAATSENFYRLFSRVPTLI